MLKSKKIKLLFLCTGNSCRSQMAEAWTRHLKNDTIEVYSAGVAPSGLDKNAVKVMAEKNIDISNHKSKNIHDYTDIDFDYIITVCGHAHETCPVVFSKSKIIHKGFDDPPQMAQKLTDKEKKLNCYRKIRDEIYEYVKTLPDALKE